MTTTDFEKLYESIRGKAVAAAVRVCGSQDAAEDAVQDAAVYCLERIAAQPEATFTASYFVQLAVNRAKDGVKPTMGRNKYLVSVGGQAELEQQERIQNTRPRTHHMPEEQQHAAGGRS